MRFDVRRASRTGAFSTIAVLTLGACAERRPVTDAVVEPASTALSEPNPHRNAYFGDLHLHTRLSLDAFLYDIETMADDAYRYAKGEVVRYLGRDVQRRAPLDFLAVTDHAEFLGALHVASQPDGPFAGTEWQRLLTSGSFEGLFARLTRDHPPELLTDELMRSQWQAIIDAAQAHYRPGKFTTFVAYEWSSGPGLQNLHRNVIFRGPDFPERPFSSYDSLRPEDLWGYLDAQRAQGIDGLAIPHNSNLSNGLMFDDRDSDGAPLSREYAERRMRNEPDLEITQTKGTSETTPELSTADEFAAFELYRYMLGGGKEGKLDGSYVRQAFARGLEAQDRIGLNPFKYGLIGASDFHSGLSSTEEDNYPGAHGRTDSAADPSAVLTGARLGVGGRPVEFSAGGLTGVWAEQNTREAIFAALRRKETFATSGGRISVRLFAGWSYPSGLLERGDWLETAYAQGVPMGADLPARPAEGSSPRLLLHAVKDPDAGNLDRIQIVKVWFKDGRSAERVFDAVWSGNRTIDPQTGKLPPVGTTVDLKTATYDDSIGAAQLIGEWTDPEFDPGTPAVYYARVLEIPTPRWTTYLAVRNELPLPDGVPPTIQERAWTSPVFYNP